MNKGLIGCLGIGAIILFVVLTGGCAVARNYNRLVGLRHLDELPNAEELRTRYLPVAQRPTAAGVPDAVPRSPSPVTTIASED